MANSNNYTNGLLKQIRLTTGKTLLKNIYDSFNETLSTHQLKIDDVIGVGIGVPGPVDFETGIVNGAVNLHWPGSVNVRQIFSEFINCPVYVDNDANGIRRKHKGAGQGATM